MARIALCDEERDEATVVLESGIFARAPNLESFFRYICERHLEGKAEELKEYCIAVEALGRPTQFDAKKNSIVRVEAHRLRKRLGEYYAGPGACHKIHISIPLGSYAPQFLPSGSASSADADPLETEDLSSGIPEPSPALLQRQPPHFSFWQSKLARLLVIGLLIVLCVALRWRVVQGASEQPAREVWKALPGQVVPPEFRILAGYKGPRFTDSQQRDWNPDAYYSGGRGAVLPEGHAIQGLPVSNFLRSARVGEFQYDIPVGEGVYEMHLYFAETEYGSGNPKGGGDSSRVFRLAINDRMMIDPLDVHAEAGGPDRLLVRVFKDISRTKDGKIHIVFSGGVAFVNAIEILPSTAGRIRPVRIVAQDHSITDSAGQLWSADEYVVGGSMVLRHEARFEKGNFALYQGERFGNFSYHIPLAPGKYRLTLHFAETWFGTPNSRINSHEHRLFDVYANGTALVRMLDLLAEAGAPNKGVEKVFEGLEPNAQGELTLQFVPVSNYAEVNAIEVVETG